MCFVKKDIRKIYNTTDGYFNDRPDIKKPRKVVALKQRKDKAIIVSKIHSKREKKGNNFINNIILSPKKHKSLSEDSIISNRIIYGKKSKNGYSAIYPNDLIYADDKLSKKEYRKTLRKINADTKQHKKTKKNTIKKWKNHFK